ncbi:MAG: hypothetical protein KBT28_12980 [Bacteroidales bacterium]|nr:hypothetical protein [Candidatus Colimorpha merdihippi]
MKFSWFRVKGILFSVLCIIAILSFCAMFFCVWKYSSIQCHKLYGIPELLYYSTQIIGVFATVAAVIVALFGREIRRYIFREKVKIHLYDGGFREMLGDTINTPTPSAQSYDCSLVIENACSKELEGIQIILNEVSYQPDLNSKLRKIKTHYSKALYWRTVENTSTDIGVEDSKRIPLFKIYPAESCQTPDNSQSSSLSMRIIGVQLTDKNNKKGVWKTQYQIRTKSKILKTFEATVQWNGEWCSRYTEMSENVSINIKEL